MGAQGGEVAVEEDCVEDSWNWLAEGRKARGLYWWRRRSTLHDGLDGVRVSEDFEGVFRRLGAASWGFHDHWRCEQSSGFLLFLFRVQLE